MEILFPEFVESLLKLKKTVHPMPRATLNSKTPNKLEIWMLIDQIPAFW